MFILYLTEIKKAFAQFKNLKRPNVFLRWALAIDHLGNAVTGGFGENTVSARTGHNAITAGAMTQWYWKLLEKYINWTFYPIDGPEHCYAAFARETRDPLSLKKFNEGSDKLKALLGIFIFICNPLIGAVIRTVLWVKPNYSYEFGKRPNLLTLLALWAFVIFCYPLFFTFTFWWQVIKTLNLIPFV